MSDLIIKALYLMTDELFDIFTLFTIIDSFFNIFVFDFFN